jgi:hypothetical protein
MWKSAGRGQSLRVLPWHLSYKLRKKHEKTSVRLKKPSVRVQYTYYQNTHTNTHILIRILRAEESETPQNSLIVRYTVFWIINLLAPEFYI